MSDALDKTFSGHAIFTDGLCNRIGLLHRVYFKLFWSYLTQSVRVGASICNNHPLVLCLIYHHTDSLELFTFIVLLFHTCTQFIGISIISLSLNHHSSNNHFSKMIWGMKTNILILWSLPFNESYKFKCLSLEPY